MKEKGPRKTILNKFGTGFRVGSALVVINTTSALGCSFDNVPFLPGSERETLSEEQKARFMESGFRLDGSGLIYIPNGGAFPEDKIAVDVLLKPDSLSLSKKSTGIGVIENEDGGYSAFSSYTIFTRNNGDFNLTMNVVEDEESIRYSFTSRLTDRDNPLTALQNSCPVTAGYSVEKEMSIEDFAKPKHITFEVDDRKPSVFVNGDRVRMHVGHEYTTPDGNYSLKEREYFDSPPNTLVIARCDVDNPSFEIGGVTLGDGRPFGSFSGEIYSAKVSEIVDKGDPKTIAEWNFNSLKDLSGNGHDARIVGNVSIVNGK